MPDESTFTALVSPQSAASVPTWQYLEGAFRCNLPVGAFPPPLVITDFTAHPLPATPFGSRTGTYVTEVTVEFNVSADTPLTDVELTAYILIDEGGEKTPAITGLPFISRFNTDFLYPSPEMEGVIGKSTVVAVTADALNLPPSSTGATAAYEIMYQRAFWGGKPVIWNEVWGDTGTTPESTDVIPSMRVGFAVPNRVGTFAVVTAGNASVFFYPNFSWSIGGTVSLNSRGAGHPLLGEWSTENLPATWNPGLSTMTTPSDTEPPPLVFPLPYEFAEVTLRDGNGDIFIMANPYISAYAAYNISVPLIQIDQYNTSPDQYFWRLDLPASDYRAAFLLFASWSDTSWSNLRPTHAHYIVDNENFDAAQGGTVPTWYIPNQSSLILPLWGDHNAPLTHASRTQGGVYPDLYCTQDSVSTPYAFSETFKPIMARWDLNVFWKDADLSECYLVITAFPKSVRTEPTILAISDVKLTFKTTTTSETIAPVPDAQPNTTEEQQVLTFSPRPIQRAIDPPPLDIATGGLVSMTDGVRLLTYIRETTPANTISYVDEEVVGTSTTPAPTNPWDITYRTITSNTEPPVEFSVISSCTTTLQGGIHNAQLLRFYDFPTAIPSDATIERLTITFTASAGTIIENYMAFYFTPPGQQTTILGPNFINRIQQPWNNGQRAITGTPIDFIGPQNAAYVNLLKTQAWGIILNVAYFDRDGYPGVTNVSTVARKITATIRDFSITFEWTAPPPPPPAVGGIDTLTPSIFSVPPNLRLRPPVGDARVSTVQSPSIGEGGLDGLVIGLPRALTYAPTDKK